ARLIFAARARGPGALQTGTQAEPIEFTGDIMRSVVRSRRSGAASFQRIRCEISDHLVQTFDAGGAGSWLLCDNRGQRKGDDKCETEKLANHNHLCTQSRLRLCRLMCGKALPFRPESPNFSLRLASPQCRQNALAPSFNPIGNENIRVTTRLGITIRSE